MVLLLKILGGVAALLLGVWLGLPGRYGQSEEDVEKVLDQPTRRSRRASRHLTPADWFRRAKRSPDRLSRHRLNLETPEKRD